MPRRALLPIGERILAAAERVFATNGYGEVSLRQLIAAAGVSTTAFYARFDSKVAVLDTMVERLFTELRSEAATTLRNVKDLDEGIDRGVEIVLACFGPRKALVRLVIAEAGALGPTSGRRRNSYAMLVGFLAHFLRALVERGRITLADPEALAWALVGAIEMQVVRWAVWDELDTDELAVQLRAVARAILPKEQS